MFWVKTTGSWGNGNLTFQKIWLGYQKHYLQDEYLFLLDKYIQFTFFYFFYFK